MEILVLVAVFAAAASILLLAIPANPKAAVSFPERLKRSFKTFCVGFLDDFRWTKAGICRRHRTWMRYTRISASIGGYVCDACDEEQERADLEKYGMPATRR